MKKFIKIASLLILAAVAVFAIYYFWGTKHYNLVMRVINFAVLALIIIKYARTPIVNFLKGKREEISTEIKEMEAKKKEAETNISETYKMLENSSLRFDKLKERIIRQGEKKKQSIIDNAKNESRIMLEGSKRKIGNQIRQAKNKFRSELIDSAVDLAMKKLPNEVKDKDNQKLLDQFLKGTSQ